MKIILCLLCFLVSASIVNAQEDSTQAYSDSYTVAKAEKIMKTKDYELATWYLINAFPTEKWEVYNNMVKIEKKEGADSIGKYIRQVFDSYIKEDPVIVFHKDTLIIINDGILELKSVWVDDLCSVFKTKVEDERKAKVYNLVALDYLQRHNYEEAYANFTEALKLHPAGEYYFNRAKTYGLSLQYLAAIRDYDTAIKEYKFNIPQAWYEKGNMYNLYGQPDIAIKCFGKAIAADKNYVEAYNTRSVLLMKKEKYKEALKDCEKAVELNPDFYKAWFNLGYAQMKLKDYDNACINMKKALSLGFTPAEDYVGKLCNQIEE